MNLFDLFLFFNVYFLNLLRMPTNVSHTACFSTITAVQLLMQPVSFESFMARANHNNTIFNFVFSLSALTGSISVECSDCKTILHIFAYVQKSHK